MKEELKWLRKKTYVPGHRQRVLKKYLEHGIDCFEDHEILEIFLFTAYPRRNTNDISHQLINRFGSLEGVLKTPGYDEIVEEKNVGVTAAALISFTKGLRPANTTALSWQE